MQRKYIAKCRKMEEKEKINLSLKKKRKGVRDKRKEELDK